MSQERSTLILGIGNLLMQDEAVGIRIIGALEKEGGVEGADLLDGGTGGFHLLGHILSYKKVVIVDASLDEFPPGHIRLLRPKFANDFPRELSAHEIGLKDLIESACLLDDTPEFYLIAISVKDFQDLGMELSPEVEAALPQAMEKVRGLVKELVE